MSRLVVVKAKSEANPEVVNDKEWPLSEEKQKWLMDALEEAHYRWHLYINSKDPIAQAYGLSDFNDRFSDLCSYHPSNDYNTGTLSWERECE